MQSVGWVGSVGQHQRSQSQGWGLPGPHLCFASVDTGKSNLLLHVFRSENVNCTEVFAYSMTSEPEACSLLWGEFQLTTVLLCLQEKCMFSAFSGPQLVSLTMFFGKRRRASPAALPKLSDIPLLLLQERKKRKRSCRTGRQAALVKDAGSPLWQRV